MTVSRISVRVSILIASLVGMPTVAWSQQSAIDTAFCKAIEDKECGELIPSGNTIDVSELQRDKNGPVVYFWGALRNPSRSGVGFYFARGGECYEESKSVGRSAGRATSSYLRSLFNWARTRTLGDLTSFFAKDLKGEASAKIKVVDVKITGAVAEPSENFRVFTFRNVLCEGRIEARLLDSQGNPITPDAVNDTKYLLITDTRRAAGATR